MLINGRRPIAGLTNNNEAGLLDLLIEWYTPANPPVKVTVSGQIVPLSGSVSHSADIRAIKDNKGNELTVLYTNEKVTIEIVAVPVGAAGTNTLAAACSAATFPAPGGWLDISNAPVIAIGSMSDALNSDAWQYNCDGRIELASEGEWGIRFSATRRVNIAKQGGVTV